MSLKYNILPAKEIIPTAPAYPLRSKSSEKRAIAENEFNDAVEEAEQYLKNKYSNKMIDNDIWGFLCGIGWLTALVLVSIELFKDNRNNDWLWGAFVSLVSTLLIPFEIWLIKNCKFLSFFNTAEWLFVVRSAFILSTVSTVIFINVSLSRARVTNKSEQWDYIQAANLAYLISSIAGHEMKNIQRIAGPESIIFKILKLASIGTALSLLLFVTGNHEVDYNKDKDDWVFTYTMISLGVYLLGSVIRDWLDSSVDIIRLVNVTSSVVSLMGVSFLFGLYNDKAFREANMLHFSGCYVGAFILVLVALVSDHVKHRVTKYFN